MKNHMKEFGSGIDFVFKRPDVNEINENAVKAIKEFVSFVESEKIELTEYQVIVCIAHMFAHNMLVAGPMRSGRSYALSTLRKFYERKYPHLCATIKGHHV